MLSLCRGLSLLKETTDSVSVWSSRVSTLPVALGLHKKKKKEEQRDKNESAITIRIL